MLKKNAYDTFAINKLQFPLTKEYIIADGILIETISVEAGSIYLPIHRRIIKFIGNST